MNVKQMIAAVAVLTATFGATLPAMAGPDWQLIEHGRQTKLAQMEKESALQAQASKPGEPPKPNQSDKESRMDNMMKECAEMMKKPA